MIKFFFKSILYLIIIFFILVGYLSTVGIETKSFNTQIKKNLKNINKDLSTELNKVKIILNPLKFQINIKTVGPIIIFKNEKLQLESIKSQIPIISLIKGGFSSTNLTISTQSINFKDLLSFLRAYDNKIKYYLLDKVITRGFLIADINLNFDENGSIKNDYYINGLVKEAKIDLLNKKKLDKINFIFNIREKSINLGDVSFLLDKISFISDNISIKKEENYFSVKGKISNNKIALSKDDFNSITDPFLKDITLEKLEFGSENDFSFKINNKFKIRNVNFQSKLEISDLRKKNDYQLKEFFPDINNEIKLKNHKININYTKDNLSIKGKGFWLSQKEFDEMEYEIKKNINSYLFKTKFDLTNNKLKINLLNFYKKKDSKSSLSLQGKLVEGKNLFFQYIDFINEDNLINVKKLSLDNDLRFLDLGMLNLNFNDIENFRNEVIIKKNKKDYELDGKVLNASKIISNLLKGNDNKSDFFKNDLKIKVNLKKVFLDNDHFINDLKGYFEIEDSKVINAELNSYFENQMKLSFTVKKIDNKKITTFFSGKAKPIINKYDFIKGYEEGSLDFYSISSNNVSNSKLKIYDFKLKELPALTKLLTLASLQGIADVLSGEGIRFDEFEMNFETNKNLMTINEIYAIGPAISILMEGYVEKDKIISLRGTLVPATTINKVIGSIPILGNILVGKKTGEGVFGVSFKIKGPPKNLETTVNPIKTLTPRFITRTLEKIKKN